MKDRSMKQDVLMNQSLSQTRTCFTVKGYSNRFKRIQFIKKTLSLIIYTHNSTISPKLTKNAVHTFSGVLCQKILQTAAKNQEIDPN